MKQNFFFKSLFLVLCGLLVLGGFLVYFWQGFSNKSQTKYVQAKIGSSPQLTLEVAKDAASIKQGLSGREKIGSDGLLFIFPDVAKRSFWMKEMKFALDLIWLKDKKIIEITSQVLPPLSGIKAENLPTYQPSQPVDMVLEVRAGQVKAWNLQVGQHLKIQSIKASGSS